MKLNRTRKSERAFNAALRHGHSAEFATSCEEYALREEATARRPTIYIPFRRAAGHVVLLHRK